jgi:hypothetical protein
MPLKYRTNKDLRNSVSSLSTSNTTPVSAAAQKQHSGQRIATYLVNPHSSIKASIQEHTEVMQATINTFAEIIAENEI